MPTIVRERWESSTVVTCEAVRLCKVWLGECDLEEPLEELLILLMLHMDDLREPSELGELGGEGCCREIMDSAVVKVHDTDRQVENLENWGW